MRLVCSCESDRDTDHRVCLPAECEFTLATDAAPVESVPVLNPAEAWMTTIPVDAEVMAEADLNRSFYEGKPHEKGKQLHEAFLQRKAEALNIAAATSQVKGRRRHG